jgi:phosphoribosylformylglycinamidine cyclo-ligase
VPSASSRTGVLTSEDLAALPRVLDVLRETFTVRSGERGAPCLDFGYYANVLDLGNNVGLAISTDGVGTKIMVAEALGKYDTIGIDCIAMNVNDVVCVGAEPIAMTDYIAVQEADVAMLAQLAVGLKRGAELARITIPGGEIAQVREMVNGIDLVGTCVGLVAVDRILTGAAARPGDALVGFASSGIHSNGLTLAREVLLGEQTSGLSHYVAELGRTLGEELLEPTRIYVDLALRLLADVDVRAMMHITGDGFINLARIAAPVGFRIEELPQTPAIFELIRAAGKLSAADMFLTYNMGVGFCAVVPEADLARTLGLAGEAGVSAQRIGTLTDDVEHIVDIAPARLRSRGGHLESY